MNLRVIFPFFLFFVKTQEINIDSLSIFSPHTENLLKATPPSFGLMMIQMLGMLLLLTGLLYFSLFFLKKVNKTYKNKSDLLTFRVYDKLYISAKQGLTAISFGKKLYIIGFSNNSVNLIDTIEDEDVLGKLSNEKITQSSFSTIFKSYFSKDK